MIFPQDDYLGHQSAGSFAEPAIADTPHAIFTERYWYTGTIVPEGDFVFDAGLGYYANRRIMDGFIGVTVDGVQHVYRASRQCHGDALDAYIGAIRITVLSGMGSHRLELGPNDSELSLDLTFHGAMEPNDEGRDRLIRHGELVADVSRYVQLGHYTGWVQLGKRRYTIEGTQCWGARDRSWGLRTEARADPSVLPVTRFRPLLFTWICAQFETHGIHAFLKERAPGDVRFLAADEAYPLGQGKPSRRIIEINHDFKFDETDRWGQHLKGGTLALKYADGTQRRLRIRALPGRFYLKAGMYGGCDGWFQGDDKGILYEEAVRWDHADANIRTKLRTLADQVIEFTDDEGRVGYGTIQGGLSEGYPKYTEVQHLPVI